MEIRQIRESKCLEPGELESGGVGGDRSGFGWDFVGRGDGQASG